MPLATHNRVAKIKGAGLILRYILLIGLNDAKSRAHFTHQIPSHLKPNHVFGIGHHCQHACGA